MAVMARINFVRVAQLKFIDADVNYNIKVNMIFYAFLIVLLNRRGHLEVVQFLVNGKFCKPDAVDEDGRSPLHLAAK